MSDRCGGFAVSSGSMRMYLQRHCGARRVRHRGCSRFLAVGEALDVGSGTQLKLHVVIWTADCRCRLSVRAMHGTVRRQWRPSSTSELL